MTADRDEPPLPSAGRRRMRHGPWAVVVLALVLALAWGGLVLVSGRPVAAPAWLTERVEARAAAALGGPGRLELGGIVVVVGPDRVPRLVLRDLTFRNAVGAEVAEVPEMRARLAAGPLLAGRLELTRLTVVGAELTLRRDPAGRFDLALGTGSGALPGATTLAGIVEAIDAAFARPALARLDQVTGEALRLTFEDAQTGRVWRAENGALALDAGAGGRALALSFGLTGGEGGGTAPVRIGLALPGDGGLDLAAELAEINAADLARQVPALSFLAAADAPVSAALDGRIGADGAVERLDAALEIGAGAVRPGGGARPLAFDGARARIAFDPAAGKITFAELGAETADVRFAGAGHAYLREVDPTTGLPRQLLFQLRLADIVVNPAGELAEPARFDQGAADLRLTLAPFRVEVGQVSLSGGGTEFLGRGSAAAEAGGWRASFDLGLDRISTDRLLALWPLRAIPRTRRWLTENVTEGVLYDVEAAIRVRPGEAPRIGVGYEFADGRVRYLPTLPPIEGGSGHASIVGSRYAMALTGGWVEAPNGERIDATRSSFVVADIDRQPAVGDVFLETESSIPAALSLIDEPPLRFLTKAGRPTDLAQGRARLSTTISTALVKNVPMDQIDFAVDGLLTDVRSEVLIPGRTLAADALSIRAGPQALEIAGAGRVGGAAFDARWRQPLGPGSGTASRVDGEVTLDQAFLDEFGIALAPGTVSGSGRAAVEIDLPRGAPAAFRLESDLAGIGLSVPALGWSLGRAATGSLTVAGTLGAPATIDRLALAAPGLSAEGRVELGAGGAFERAVFDRVEAGRWLDAPVTLTGRGPGRAPAIAVTGGSVDLRYAELGRRGNGGGGGGPLTLALDRLTVSEGIALGGFRADLSTAGGLSGRFSGQLAGRAPLQGALAPAPEGTAIRVQAADAGAVLGAAGILKSARRGALDLTLIPLPGEGRYDGRVAIRDLSLQGAPALADLLSAVSVVGLLEQLNGQGILFGEVTGEFTLEPAGLTLRRGSAVGASLGVSMAGVYDLRSKMIDMQGTISPIYLLNGIGQIFSRRGEGLFGFNYRMTGPADNPRTQVNPLSILTPGMFREIFRTAPPRLTQ